MTKPISPDDVDEASREIPDGVFRVFNKLIAEHIKNGRAVILQKEAAALVASALGLSTDRIFELRYLDVEDHYRKAGWNVEYDKPAYCESYEASFTFSKKK